MALIFITQFFPKSQIEIDGRKDEIVVQKLYPAAILWGQFGPSK